jgi:hypothetical protein
MSEQDNKKMTRQIAKLVALARLVASALAADRGPRLSEHHLKTSFAKGDGYSNSVHDDHGALLRSIEEIFGITLYLGNAANQSDLKDFSVVP